MTLPFQDLLNELGKVFHLSLHIDKKNACSIQIREHAPIQLQLDTSQENLILFSKITEIPPGKFRENVLREALKANGLPDPRIGNFGYLEHSNQLILYQKYPLKIMTGERLAGLFGSFLEFASSWRAAIQRGQSAPPKPATERPR